MRQRFLRNHSNLADCFLVCLCAGLLTLAYPKTDFSLCAWFGLVPLLFALDGKRPAAAFRLAYVCGFLFFTGTFFWFFHLIRWFSFIAAFGVFVLLLYLALYFGLFGLCYGYLSGRAPLVKLILLPCVWVVLEFVRSRLFTGFDWASLGHSQYKNLLVIQMADFAGVFGVSFVIAVANVFLKESMRAGFKNVFCRQNFVSAIVVGVMLVFVFGYGALRLRPSADHGQAARPMRVAVIQANIAQEMKWQKRFWPKIMQRQMDLTEQAARHNPELVIWPETSYPGYLWEDRELFDRLKDFVRRHGVDLLFGSVVMEEGKYYNAALLLSKDGQVDQVYRKVHLVPFGEYVPLRFVFPFLSRMIDIGDFTPGARWTTFRRPMRETAGGKGGLYSVLICFEDAIARLSRQFVLQGAQLLVNITNDAWFGDSRAPYLHLQSSVFRAVENRKSLVRAANTGPSCFIDSYGRVTGCVQGPGGKEVYVSGYAVREADFNGQKTFYTKYGDVFTIFCFGCILITAVGGMRKGGLLQASISECSREGGREP